VDNLSQETSKGKRQRAQKGGWNGTLPFGYTTIRKMQTVLVQLGERFKESTIGEEEYSQVAALYETSIEQNQATKGETDAIIYPINGPGVILAFENYSLGIYSDNDIAIMLNKQGYQTTGQWGANRFGKDTVLPMLQNRFYVGETSYQGKKKGAQKQYIQGKHEALISLDLFEKCQEVRVKRAGNWSRGSARQKEVYPLSSLLVCPHCGSTFRGQKTHDQRRYRDPAKDRAVDCCSTVKSMSAQVPEAAAAEILLSINLPEDWRQRLIALLDKEAPRHGAVRKQSAQLELRLERLKQLFVKGDLNEDEYRTMRDKLRATVTGIQLTNQGTMIDFERAVQLLGNLKEIWQHATLEEREIWFKLMFEKVYVDNGAIKAIEPTPILSALLDTLDGSDGLRYLLGIQWILFRRVNQNGKIHLGTLVSFLVIILLYFPSPM
jgi:hypothetical protein